MIFPKLVGKRFGYVNLNLEAQDWSKKNNLDESKNPLTNPEACQSFVEAVHKKYNIDFSYGGWMEDRSYIWRGWYLDQSQFFTHFGIDLNVPVGTEVAADFEAEVVLVMDDYPLDGGWGPHMILKNLEKDIYILYAHLDKNILCKVGDKLSVGQVFARVGHAPENGNWFPHVHVQAIEKNYFEHLKNTNGWESFDGYGSIKEVEANSKLHPDPLQYIRLD